MVCGGLSMVLDGRVFGLFGHAHVLQGSWEHGRIAPEVGMARVKSPGRAHRERGEEARASGAGGRAASSPRAGAGAAGPEGEE
jgi:hypothetical protein